MATPDPMTSEERRARRSNCRPECSKRSVSVRPTPRGEAPRAVDGAVASVRGVADGGASAPPRRTPGVAWITVDDEIVALDRAGRAHVITSTGALLWPLLDG